MHIIYRVIPHHVTYLCGHFVAFHSQFQMYKPISCLELFFLSTYYFFQNNISCHHIYTTKTNSMQNYIMVKIVSSILF